MYFQGIGIGYHTAGVDMRGLCSLDAAQQAQLLTTARTQGMEGVLVLATCNRTELYASGAAPGSLHRLLLDHVAADAATLPGHLWHKEDSEAVGHLLRVAAGLDSMVPGDLQIIGQVKAAFALSKTLGTADGLLERLVNLAIHTSKRIKNETRLSDGSASVSYTAIQALRRWIQQRHIDQPRILVMGAGEIGQTTCLHLRKYLPAADLSITNRNDDKARTCADRCGILAQPWHGHRQAVQTADVVIVATAAPQPVVTQDMLTSDHPQLFVDLAVPRNVDPAIDALPGKTRIDMDDLAAATRDTLARRQADMPAAEAIVDAAMADFTTWLDTRRLAPFLQSLKTELAQLHDAALTQYRRQHPGADLQAATAFGDQLIHRMTARVARFLQHVPAPDTLPRS